MSTKFITVTVALLVALSGAWLWGASGRWALARENQALTLRQDLIEGRSTLLEARLDVYSVNFGEASRHLEAARALLRGAGAQLATLGRSDQSKEVEAALTAIDDAQRMAGNLDQNANSRAGDAAKIIAGLLDAGTAR